MRVSGAEPGLKGLRIGSVSMTRITGSGAWSPDRREPAGALLLALRSDPRGVAHRVVHRFTHSFCL